jgi:hypothetical protein
VCRYCGCRPLRIAYRKRVGHHRFNQHHSLGRCLPVASSGAMHNKFAGKRNISSSTVRTFAALQHYPSSQKDEGDDADADALCFIVRNRVLSGLWHASPGLKPPANSPVALMTRLLKVGLSWPSQRESPSRRGYHWALYVGYLTAMGGATLGWIWFLVWCVWQLA